MRPVEHRTKKGIAVFGIKYNITANAEVLEPIVIVVLSTATVYVSTPEAHVNGIQKRKRSLLGGYTMALRRHAFFYAPPWFAGTTSSQ